MTLDDIKMGDVLLFRPKEKDVIGNIIAFCSNGGKYCHSARCISKDNGVTTIIESIFEKGVCTRELHQSELDVIDIFFIPGVGLTQITEMCKVELFQLGKGYDALVFPSTFFKSVVARFFGWKYFSRCRPLLNDPERFCCSELQSRSIFDVLGVSPVRGLSYMSTTPSDLGSRNSILKKRKIK